MDQTAIEEEVELGLANWNQGQGVDRFVKVCEQTPRQRERLILEICRGAVMDNEVHAGLDRNSDLSVSDVHRVTHDPYLLVKHRLAGPDVVFPRMPRAAQNATLVTVVELVHL